MCRLLCFLLASAVVAEARVKKDEGTILKATQSRHASAGIQAPLSPTLRPESDADFIDDFHHDKAPPRNGLHFKHPYPVVQDSDDFDKDFVKDQNSDNGEFQAQQYYDYVRQKMQKQYEVAEKALEKKKKVEKQVEESTEEYKEATEEAKSKVADDIDELNEIEKARDEARMGNMQKPKKPEEKKEGCWWPWSMWCCGWWPWSCPDPKPVVDPMDKYRDAHKTLADDVEGAVRDVEEAVDDLKECQRQLSEAKEELRRLLEEREKAVLRKEEADEKVKQTKLQELESEKKVLVLKKALSDEVAEADAAQAAYLKQKAIVDKMSAELEILAKKVEALRDNEDKNGGVYPVKLDKDDVSRRSRSFARSAQAVLPLFGILTLMIN